MNRLVIVGASGHGRVVLDAALRSASHEILGFLDDSETIRDAKVAEYEVLGAFEWGLKTLDKDVAFHIAIGNNRIRHALTARVLEAGRRLATVVHPMATVADRVTIGEGSSVMAGAVVQPDSCIGRSTIINTRASIDHDCRLGDAVHVAPGTTLCGTIKVGEGAFIGAGATIIPGKVVGAWTTVGAGAVVVRDLPSHVVALGVPALPQG